MLNIRFVDLIAKKKNGFELTKTEIEFIIKNYVNGQIQDYQMSAFMMAIVFQGMSDDETTQLTLAMMNSGVIIDLSDIVGIKVDKHSTGGVGDKTTIAVAPIVASLGAKVAKMSGRGLGHTGGTLDKLESISGMSIQIEMQDFKKQVNQIGIAVIGQTHDIVPADKKMYALRDVTGTVNSIPLIASSIMSKKLATGSNAILLDVKCGNGAFMKDLKSAKELATKMINIGKLLKRDVRVDITNMDRPLGRMIGNKNEIIEAMDLLKGKKVSNDLLEVVVSAATIMLLQAKMFPTQKAAEKAVYETIKSGKALEKFYEFIKYQGGDLKILQSDNFWKPKYQYQILASKKGFVNIISAIEFGICAMKLGAGRSKKTDVLDMDAGIYINKKTNEAVKKGEVLFVLYSSKPINAEILETISQAYEIRSAKIKNEVILEQLN